MLAYPETLGPCLHCGGACELTDYTGPGALPPHARTWTCPECDGTGEIDYANVIDPDDLYAIRDDRRVTTGRHVRAATDAEAEAAALAIERLEPILDADWQMYMTSERAALPATANTGERP